MCIARVTRSAFPIALTALLFSTAAFRPGIFAADTPPALTPPDVVELPTLQVTDTRELPPPDKWRYTTIPGFEVISNASDRETRRLVRDFEIFRMALDIAWPMKKVPLPPSALILCGKGKSFDAFVPDAEAGPDRGKASLLLNNHEQGFILIDLALKNILASTIAADSSSGQMNLTYSIAGARDVATEDDDSAPEANATFEVDHYKQLYREYLRLLFSQSGERTPVWLEEGIAQIVMKMDFTDRLIVFGKIQDANTAGNLAGMGIEDQDFNLALRRKKLLSFDEFFGVTRDSETARNTIGNNPWAKQAYAFTHMCLYGMRGQYKKAFENFVARCRTTPATEEIFAECFGKPYKKFLIELRGYIDFTNFEYKEYRIKGKEILNTPPPEMRDATEGESERIKGDALRLAGKAASARDFSLAAYIRGERDPFFLATLGQSELAAGNNERAQKFLEASQPRAARASALLDLARLRFDAANLKPAGTGKRLSAGQTASVIDPLLAARKLTPPLPGVYRLIAATWIRSASSPKPENQAVLAEGLKLFPRDSELVYDTAVLNFKLGNHEAARALSNYGEKIATDDNDHLRFAQLKSKLPPPAAKP